MSTCHTSKKHVELGNGEEQIVEITQCDNSLATDDESLSLQKLLVTLLQIEQHRQAVTGHDMHKRLEHTSNVSLQPNQETIAFTSNKLQPRPSHNDSTRMSVHARFEQAQKRAALHFTGQSVVTPNTMDANIVIRLHREILKTYKRGMKTRKHMYTVIDDFLDKHAIVAEHVSRQHMYTYVQRSVLV